LERLLEDISFEASDMRGARIEINAAMVEERLGELSVDQDLSQYIL
jgi:ATP-dependent HslUV protease ATP-binding subunit HslU